MSEDHGSPLSDDLEFRRATSRDVASRGDPGTRQIGTCPDRPADGRDSGPGWDFSGTGRDFEEWTDGLRTAGFLLCPRSSAVPVELRGLRPDGVGFHLLCRGVRVTLSLFRPGREMWALPSWDPRWTPEEGLSLWVTHPVDHSSGPAAHARFADTARMVFDQDEVPDHQVYFDGGRDCGWRGHEAGLLRPAAAAALFGRLMVQADPVATFAAVPQSVPHARKSWERLASTTAR